MAKKISILNPKGGCGKTTLSSNLGSSLLLNGYKTLLIDTDPQGTLRDWKSMDENDSQPQIIVINTAVPRPWRDSNNAIISKVASNYANVKLVDWDPISKDRPELFAPDGVHLSPAGSDVYVDLVVSELVKTPA